MTIQRSFIDDGKVFVEDTETGKITEVATAPEVELPSLLQIYAGVAEDLIGGAIGCIAEAAIDTIVGIATGGESSEK